MNPCYLDTFIILGFLQSFMFHPSHGSEVLQSLTVGQFAFINCTHNVSGAKLTDVRLIRNSITTSGIICQMGMKKCDKVFMLDDKSTYVFALHLVPEVMNFTYQCEVTVSSNHLYDTYKGEPFKLPRHGEKPEKEHEERTLPFSPHLSKEHIGILISLVALMIMYICFITFLYIRQRMTFNKIISEKENSTYVEMKKPCHTRQFADI